MKGSIMMLRGREDNKEKIRRRKAANDVLVHSPF